MMNLKYYLVTLLIFLSNVILAQSTTEHIYIAPSGNMVTHPGAQMGIFGNIINDAAGGLNHNNGGDVYFYNHTDSITSILDGPISPVFTGNYNVGGSFVRFYNFYTDNNGANATPSGTLVNNNGGNGDINILQETRITNLHTFVNGTIWTPRNNWKHAFMHYDADGASYTNHLPNNTTTATNRLMIDGYAAKTGSSSFMFPIGDGIYSRQSGISNPSLGTYKSAYFAKNAPIDGTVGLSGNNALPDVVPNIGAGIVKVNKSEFWDIDGTASSNYIITALNSIPGYSNWDSVNNFKGLDPNKTTITGYDAWQDLGINAMVTAFNIDGTFSTTTAVTPDANFSAFTWANKSLTLIVPDINVTSIGVPVAGSLNTNDNVSPNTTYGNPSIFGTNPSTDVPNILANGTYTFTTNVPGTYQFLVPVCPPNISINCPLSLLSITVLDSVLTNSNPAVNTDLATVITGNNVVINTLGNDLAANNPTNILLPSTVAITQSPNNGTATVDAITGNITYLPNANFVGIDTLKYTVCTNASPSKCASAYQIITVLPLNAENTTSATDDYNTTTKNIMVFGNVKLNDIDAQLNTQAVIPQNTSVAGKGLLSLLADGTYTFLPAPNYVGPVQFTYTTCDNGTPIVCANATLYIMVLPGFANPLGFEFSNYDVVNLGCKADVIWTSPYIADADYFGIYRKKFDQSSFMEIDKVAPIVNGNTAVTYTYHDTKVSAGAYQYKIVLFKINTTYVSTEIKNVVFDCGTGVVITVFPNPTTDDIFVTVENGEEGDYKLKLIDMAGKIVFIQDATINGKTQTLKLPMQAYTTGNYILEVSNDYRKKLFKIFKQ
jgi:Secretion system C-terminal sorting domain/Bacterial Ig domain